MKKKIDASNKYLQLTFDVSRIFEDHTSDPSTREADMIKSEGCSDYAIGSTTNGSGFDSL